MFDAKQSDTVTGRHPVRVTPLTQLARDGSLGLTRERSYMAPVLFWIANGQGRFSVNGDLRGYTANNVIYLPANLVHGIEIAPRCYGSAVFFANPADLPLPPDMLHLRLHGVRAQTEMSGLIEDMRRDAESTAPDSALVLFHRAALTLLWLRRQSGQVNRPTAGVTDMLRSIARSSP